MATTTAITTTDRANTDRSNTDRSGTTPRRGWRSRWAAIGAAVAVTLGAGGLAVVGATTSPPSSFVAITPERVLDTRVGLGLDGPFTSPTGRDLQISGEVATPGGPQVLVPDGATAVALNVTVVGASADGFVSVRPSGTPGAPTTSNLNFSAGDVTPNAVIVALPTAGSQAGSVELLYDALGAVGPTADLLVDVTGFFVVADGSGSAATGPQGPAGPAGPAGPQGPAGADGADGANAFTPARVVQVAVNGTPDGTNGAFDSVQAAVDSITDASPTDRYLVKIGPGTFDGRVSVTSHVHLEGSGVGVTTLTSPSTSASTSPTPATSTVFVGNGTDVGIRGMTVFNTGGTNNGRAIGVIGSTQVTISDARAVSTGSSVGFAVAMEGSEVDLSRVRVAATGGNASVGVASVASLPTLRDVTIDSTANVSTGISLVDGSIMIARSLRVVAGGGSNSYGLLNRNSDATIESSDLSGGTSAILNEDFAGDSQPVSKVGASRLVNGVSGVPTFRCGASYNEDFATLSSVCT